jgi:hypothetical protein
MMVLYLQSPIRLRSVMNNSTVLLSSSESINKPSRQAASRVFRTLKMKIVCSSETSDYFTRPYGVTLQGKLLILVLKEKLSV